MNRTTEHSMNSTRVVNHLTEEQMYGLLDAKGDAGEAQVHVDACQRCATEFAAVRQSLEGFKLAATGLAKAEFSPVLPVRDGFMSSFRQSLMAWPLGLAAAGVLLAASLTMIHQPGPGTTVHTASVTAAPLESDEALLESINQDLSSSVPPSMEPLSVASAEGAETVSKHN